LIILHYQSKFQGNWLELSAAPLKQDFRDIFFPRGSKVHDIERRVFFQLLKAALGHTGSLRPKSRSFSQLMAKFLLDNKIKQL